MTIHAQTISVLTLFFCGTCIGILFDFYRVLSRFYTITRWLQAICDMIYWVVVFFIVTTILDIREDGELRGYLVFSFLIGLFFYFFMVSTFMLKCLTKVTQIFHHVFNVMASILRITIFNPIKFSLQLVNIILSFFVRIAIFLLRNMIQSLWRPIKFILGPVGLLLQYVYSRGWVKKTTCIIACILRKWFKL